MSIKVDAELNALNLFNGIPESDFLFVSNSFEAVTSPFLNSCPSNEIDPDVITIAISYLSYKYCYPTITSPAPWLLIETFSTTSPSTLIVP